MRRLGVVAVLLVQLAARRRPSPPACRVEPDDDQPPELYQISDQWRLPDACAGDEAVAARFFEAVRPFVYRPGLDPAIVRAVRDMKGQIDRALRGQDASHRTVKRGRGGLRPKPADRGQSSPEGGQAGSRSYAAGGGAAAVGHAGRPPGQAAARAPDQPRDGGAGASARRAARAARAGGADALVRSQTAPIAPPGAAT